MTKIVKNHAARLDLFSIWSYIAEDNAAAADRVLDSINHACTLLAQHPHMGSLREDLGKNIRYFTSGSYLIFYRIESDDIKILRVLHGARNLNALFSIDEHP